MQSSGSLSQYSNKMKFVKIFPLALLLCLLVEVHSAKIAVLIFPAGGSHFSMMEPIGQQLEARGHKVKYFQVYSAR